MSDSHPLPKSLLFASVDDPAFETHRSQVEDTSIRRAVPTAILIGGVLLGGFMLMAGLFLFSGGENSVDAQPQFAIDAGPLPGEIETEPGAQAWDAVHEDLDPIDRAEPLPAHPEWQDEVTELRDRLETVEGSLEHLRQRHASVAASLDILIAGEPWARQGSSEIQVLGEVREQAQSVRRLEQRLDRLEAERQERARAAAAQPPFELIAIDWWNREPYATLLSEGRYTRVQEGESISGWSLDELDVTRREAAFSRAGQVVRLRVQGG
jgi:hypothetical protein